MEVYINKAWKKEPIANTLIDVNNDIELFFLVKGDKRFCLFLYKKCVRGFTLDKKSCDWKMYNREGLIF